MVRGARGDGTGRRRRVAGVVALLVALTAPAPGIAQSSARVAALPDALRAEDACRSLAVRPPGEDLERSARAARACIADACAARPELPATLVMAIEVNADGRPRARLVRGSLGSRERDRCAVQALEHAPFPRRPRSETEVSLTIRPGLPISTPYVRPPRAEPSGPPATPSRQDVAREMRRLTPEVAACHRGEPPVVRVRIVFRSDGRVIETETLGHEAGSRTARCVDRVLRREARIPPFTEETFPIRYPFRRSRGSDEPLVDDDPRAAELPMPLRQHVQCRALVQRSPGRDVARSVRAARPCVEAACLPDDAPATVELHVVVRNGARRARVRIVEGSLGSRGADRCVTRALEHAPYPASARGRTRVRLGLGDPDPLSRAIGAD